MEYARRTMILEAVITVSFAQLNASWNTSDALIANISLMSASSAKNKPSFSASRLRAGLETLYWEGVRLELECILRALKTVRQPENEKELINLFDTCDGTVFGFEKFVDQVSEESQQFAEKYGKDRSRVLFVDC